VLFPHRILKNHITDFWNNFGGHKTHYPKKSQSFRLRILQEYAEIKIPFKNQMSIAERRERFNAVKRERHSLGTHKNCWICNGKADVRHHIIQLKNGGINSSRNLVSLCNPCHADVHPHLKAKENKWN
jgi:5-methylcytosine-specific restriction endonuclease McrA